MIRVIRDRKGSPDRRRPYAVFVDQERAREVGHGKVLNLRHRLLFHREWSVGVVRDRRFLWPKKVRLERYPDENRARRRAVEVMAEVEAWPV